MDQPLPMGHIEFDGSEWIIWTGTKWVPIFSDEGQATGRAAGTIADIISAPELDYDRAMSIL